MVNNEYIEVPGIGKVGLHLVRATPEIMQVIAKERIKDYRTVDDNGTLTGLTGKEVIKILSQLGSRLMTTDEFEKIKAYAKENCPELYQDFEQGLPMEMVRHGKGIDTIVLGEPLGQESELDDYQFKYDPQGIINLTGFREIR